LSPIHLQRGLRSGVRRPYSFERPEERKGSDALAHLWGAGRGSNFNRFARWFEKQAIWTSTEGQPKPEVPTGRPLGRLPGEKVWHLRIVPPTDAGSRGRVLRSVLSRRSVGDRLLCWPGFRSYLV